MSSEQEKDLQEFEKKLKTEKWKQALSSEIYREMKRVWFINKGSLVPIKELEKLEK